MQNERELLIEAILARMREQRESVAVVPSRGSPQPGCSEQTDLMDVALGQAPPAVVKAVEEHLPGCDYCRACFAAYQRAARNEEVPEPEGDESLWHEMDSSRSDFVVPNHDWDRATGSPSGFTLAPSRFTLKTRSAGFSPQAREDIRQFLVYYFQAKRLPISRIEACLRLIEEEAPKLPEDASSRALLPQWVKCSCQ